MGLNFLHNQELPVRGFTYLLFALALVLLTYAFILQKWILACVIISMPLGLLLFFYSIQYPLISFTLYASITYFFGAIVRYTKIDGISIIIDILLLYTLLSVIFNAISERKLKTTFSNAFNALTIGYFAWMLFAFIQLLNPQAPVEDFFISSRSWVLGTPLLYLLASLLLDSRKKLQTTLIILGCFTIIVFLKLLWQKYKWFDAAETAWLLEGNWRTHLLRTGIRYFSLFSDAGNFGAIMGMTSLVYGITVFYTSQKVLRIFYLIICLMGIIGLLMSGTRGAIIVPLGGLVLYCLISRNIKVMVISAVLGVAIFSFFTFTNIGDGNSMIRRMRTAFRPTEDASFNVRLENQKIIADYLKEHPLGAGIGGIITTTVFQEDQYNDLRVPPDSFYVDIWSQTGFWGLSLYIFIFAVVFLRSCYIIMFKIRDKQLRNILAALLCGLFGLFLNGYVGRSMGFMPGTSLIAFFFAFILNGPYMDKQINKIVTTKI